MSNELNLHLDKSVNQLKGEMQHHNTQAYHLKHVIEKRQEMCDHSFEDNERSSISYFSATCTKCDKTIHY